MQPDKLRQWHMWQHMSWVQLPTQSGPHAQRPMKVSVTRQVAWNVNGNVHNFRAKSGTSCLTTRSCATKSVGSYSIVDRLAQITPSAQQRERVILRGGGWKRWWRRPSVAEAAGSAHSARCARYGVLATRETSFFAKTLAERATLVPQAYIRQIMPPMV